MMNQELVNFFSLEFFLFYLPVRCLSPTFVISDLIMFSFLFLCLITVGLGLA